MRDATLDRDVRRVRQLARMLDSAVALPGTRVRFGLDAVLGLIPGGGDAVTAAIALYPVVVAVRHHLPAAIVLRLIGNVALDALVGTVPLLGDLFDVAFRANLRNLALIERYAEQPAQTAGESRVLLWLLVGAMLLVIAAAVAAGLWIMSRIYTALGG